MHKKRNGWDHYYVGLKDGKKIVLFGNGGSAADAQHIAAEFVGKYNDVSFYDNSIGTVPMATIEAVKALKTVDTIIIGGMDRGLDYTDFIKYLNESEINNVICMPKTGHDIAKELNDDKVIKSVEKSINSSMYSKLFCHK